jgi:rod shape determining protein RodA
MPLLHRIRASFGDTPLLFTVLALTLFGVAMIFSAGRLDVPDPGVTRAWRLQLMWLGISLLAFLLVMRVPVRWLEWIALPLYLASLLVLALTLVIGTGAGTAASTKSWLRFGPIGVQPSQFANVATVLMLAKVMGAWREQPDTVWRLWQPIAITAVPVLMVWRNRTWAGMVFGEYCWPRCTGPVLRSVSCSC